ncbi:GntR family transcriptional regulator [Labrys miyagiensis]|uniref:GntR family transcriptional regulator n=1 Tax=Labrys miyagiensis TaxID=346912 RepID=UPI0024E080B6|nr:GntR family transcriptional regulator [Labrys miyagiensis]
MSTSRSTSTSESKSAPVHDKVYEAIRTGLVGGRFVPGRPVTLRGLADMLEVSPMPVRAAVTRLVAEGALALTATRRVSVPVMTPARFEELVRVRMLLEGEAAERALPAINAERLALIRAHDARVEACLAEDNAEGYMQANHAFHFAIYSAVPSTVLLPLIETLWLQFGPFMRNVYDGLDMTGLVDQHGRAIQAIEQGNAAELRAAIEADIGDGMRIIGKTALG